MAHRIGRLFAIVLIAMLGGCGTIATLSDGRRVPYGGTRLDGAVACEGLSIAAGFEPADKKFDRQTWLVLGTCAASDLPFSIAADTACLPITLAAVIKMERVQESENSN
jgi:uncharacterized protein YceK